jgi:glycosyltransferase involved in cell wall biosynthesis
LLPEATRSKACLLFVGPTADEAFDRELKNQAASAPDSNRILFLGATNEPFSWLNVADIYISCSEYEGMPLSCIEAVGSHLPSLLSNIPGHAFLSEYVTLFNLDAPAEGAECLARLIAQSLTSVAPSQDNRDRVEQLRNTFSFKTMVGKYVELYESVQPS